MNKVYILRVLALEHLIEKFSNADCETIEILKRTKIEGITEEQEIEFKQATIALFNAKERFYNILKELKQE